MPLDRLGVENERVFLTAYLNGELSAEEVEAFEIYSLSRPELLRAIDADIELRIAARGDVWSRSESAPSANDAVPTAGTADLWARAGNSRRWLSMVACFVAGVGSMALVSIEMRSPLETGRATDFTRIVFDGQRGPTSKPDIFGGTHTEWILLDFRVPDGASQSRVALDHGVFRELNVADGFASALIRRREWTGARTATLEYQVDGRQRTQEIDLATGDTPVQ